MCCEASPRRFAGFAQQRTSARTLRKERTKMDTQDSQAAAASGMTAAQTGQGPSEKGLMVAVKFWEPRRLLYNLLLCVVVMIWLVKTWPHFRPAMNLEALGIMTVLALLANVCYCAAYLAEILIQNATTSVSWNRQRWAIWVVGTLFAIFFENYWIADEIYPFVR